MASTKLSQGLLPQAVNPTNFNPNCVLPYGLTTENIFHAMDDFIGFLSLIDEQLLNKSIAILESLLMPAGFSGIVGEFMNVTLPKYCGTLVKNRYHNGHPDLLPVGVFPHDAVQHSREGIELKCSRHAGGWQGHNPENIWLVVFHFDSSMPNHVNRKNGARPFEFKGVFAARLETTDWNFSGRSAASRRTITARVNRQGVEKMKANWIYRVSGE